ncbi:hypothetical protein GF402_02135 [Candidatus Fermentibacteria bacterium]|nr:hypothetical protein [Candidatus Fermentibacteria bacterium]
MKVLLFLFALGFLVTGVSGEETDSGDSLALDLSGWVSLALRSSPDLVSARASVNTSEAALTASRSFMWPSLTFSASAGHEWTSSSLGEYEVGSGQTDYDSYSSSLLLSQELLSSGGSSWMDLYASRHRLQASRQDYRQTELDVVLEVVESYYSFVEARELLESSRRTLRRSSSQLEKTEHLYDLGAATTLEITQARVRESSDRLDVAQRRQALSTAYYDLCEAAGVEPDGSYAVRAEEVFQPLTEEDVQSIPLVLDGNPSLVAQSERLFSTEDELSASKRSYWPSLNARGRWSWSSTEFDLGGVPEEDSWSVSLNLTWSIFDGWLRESNINSARASVLQSRASLESLRRSLRTGLESAYENLLYSIRSYELAELSLEQARKQLELSQTSYDLGALSLLDLLEAQEGLSDAEASVVSARISCLKAEAGLWVLMGRMPRLGE